MPHALLAEGRPFFGGGEVVFRDGRVESVNPYTGHYFPGEKFKSEFDSQVKSVFIEHMRSISLSEVDGGGKVYYKKPIMG